MDETARVSLSLPEKYTTALSGYIDKAITMGIRPEAIFTAGVHTFGENALPLEVRLDVVEPMGNEIIMYTDTATHPLIARVVPQQLPSLGENVDVVLDADKLHFFDLESGQAIQ